MDSCIHVNSLLALNESIIIIFFFYDGCRVKVEVVVVVAVVVVNVVVTGVTAAGVSMHEQAVETTPEA